LKLPAAWDFQGPWMVFGDWREIELRGVAPKEAGECQLQVLFWGGFRNPHPCCQKTATIRWK
jgi:hypothetical protein